MAKITIDGKEYDREKLPKEAINLVNSIAFVDGEIIKLSNRIKLMQVSRRFYSEQLRKILANLPVENENEKINFS